MDNIVLHFGMVLLVAFLTIIIFSIGRDDDE